MTKKVAALGLSFGLSGLMVACGGSQSTSNNNIQKLQFGDGRSVAGVEQRLYVQGTNDFEITDLHSIYLESTGKSGLGFYLSVQDGTKYFIYQDAQDPDNSSAIIQGTDVGNIRKKVLAAMKHAGTIDVIVSSAAKGFSKSLVDLGTANRRLSPAEQEGIAISMKDAEIAAGNVASDIQVVEKANLAVTTSEFTMECSNVQDVSAITTTTGGSVHIFHIAMKTGDQLNVNYGTQKPDAMALLEASRSNIINACLGRNDTTMYIGWNIFQEEIYTLDGTFTGFITNPENLVLRSNEPVDPQNPNPTDPQNPNPI